MQVLHFLDGGERVMTRAVPVGIHAEHMEEQASDEEERTYRSGIARLTRPENASPLPGPTAPIRTTE